MVRIAVIVGSTRPGRRAETVARWVEEMAGRHPSVEAGEASLELIDVADYDLPLLDEPVPALFGGYHNEHTSRWAATIASFDGFVFVTPEYNHSVPAALKNAIDFLYGEWNDKAAGFVSYGVHGGTRAVEHLRLALAEVQVASVRTQVALSAFADFEPSDPTDPDDVPVLAAGAHQTETLMTLVGEVVRWAGALQALRGAASGDASGGTSPARTISVCRRDKTEGSCDAERGGWPHDRRAISSKQEAAR